MIAELCAAIVFLIFGMIVCLKIAEAIDVTLNWWQERRR